MLDRLPISQQASDVLDRLGVPGSVLNSGSLPVRSPIDGKILAHLREHDPLDVADMVGKAQAAFWAWRMVPAPRRGEFVRRLGTLLRTHKDDLGRLVAIETGKILQESLGEVQEMIDICDFAVGLSRQLYGLTMTSERPGHRMMETWHPLGPIGVITTFNFPVAVWSWNAALALVCGDAVVWKPSEKTPLCALACAALVQRAAKDMDDVPANLVQVLVGGPAIGQALVDDPRLPLISATGSTAMGRALAPRVAARFGRCLLELGGNNAMIVAPSADMDLTVRAATFSAVGTAGQRCTSLRRMFVHEDVRDALLARLKKAFASVTVGNPLDPGVLIGPLIDRNAFDSMDRALAVALSDHAIIHSGGRIDVPKCPDGWYVRPALVEMPVQTAMMATETFAPILYVMTYRDLGEAIALQNAVPHGLSSCIFTNDIREAELFMSVAGADCGIANVNIGPSGAEIGGAFGGEKETGGGRVAGSDSWKSYMRRATNAINYSRDLPLAQGIRFDLG